MVDFITMCGRGANAPKAAPEDGDIAKVVAHAHPDIEIFIPKVFEAKTVKEGGDPIMLKGPEAFETVISGKIWSELSQPQDTNEDGVVDLEDCPVTCLTLIVLPLDVLTLNHSQNCSLSTVLTLIKFIPDVSSLVTCCVFTPKVLMPYLADLYSM